MFGLANRGKNKVEIDALHPLNRDLYIDLEKAERERIALEQRLERSKQMARNMGLKIKGEDA